MGKRYSIQQKNTKVSSSTTAHLNQHYNKDEDCKLDHGSAVGGYDNVVSCE